VPDVQFSINENLKDQRIPVSTSQPQSWSLARFFGFSKSSSTQVESNPKSIGGGGPINVGHHSMLSKDEINFIE
jgi:hypothetical protein